MGKLLVLLWVVISGMVEVLVSGVWMSVWVAGLVGFSYILLIGGFSVYWVILSLVYLGGVFILLVYVSGSDYMLVGVGGGGFLVSVGLTLVLVVGLIGGSWGSPEALSVLGFSNGGFLIALITAPMLLWVMVNVNWILYGQSGTLRSV
uniref:NADH dehydrogenase subunit 6 n=1 Tax=Corynosoma villosum TaxID=141829 RepID=UPI002E77573B|nr:NADH dehydrogenase subunit 6 [Corynosoma villosum]WPN89818.1 NADH dehydrogenase subunit 6 [Corynosoma villosum]